MHHFNRASPYSYSVRIRPCASESRKLGFINHKTDQETFPASWQWEREKMFPANDVWPRWASLAFLSMIFKQISGSCKARFHFLPCPSREKIPRNKSDHVCMINFRPCGGKSPSSCSESFAFFPWNTYYIQQAREGGREEEMDDF